MAWTNVFDIGACTVEVSVYGTLIAPANYAANGITVTTTGGVVNVSKAALDGVLAAVRPSYDTLSRAVRVRAMSEDDPGVLLQEAQRRRLTTTNLIALSGLGPFTPDPAEFPSPAAWDTAGVQMAQLS